MKKSLISLAVLAAAGAAGCASIENTGYREVKVTHAPSGGCDLAIKDGKEQKAAGEKFNGKDCTYEAQGSEVKAFKGTALAVKALTVLPVNDLGSILGPDK